MREKTGLTGKVKGDKKMKGLLLVIVLVAAGSLFCDEIVLSNGQTLTGDIIAKQGDILYLQVFSGVYGYQRSDIIKIVKGGSEMTEMLWRRKDFRDGDIGEAELVTIESDHRYANLGEFQKGQKNSKIELNWFRLSFCVLGLSFGVDSLWDAIDLGDAIKKADDKIKKADDKINEANNGINISDLKKEISDWKKEKSNWKKQRDRKYIFGGIGIAVGLVNGIMSFERVELEPLEKGVSVSYKF